LLPSQLLTVEVSRRPVESAQYTSGDYATLADDLAVCLSTSRTGQCWDNALAESFFASLKGECLDHQPWPTRAAARHATVEYIAWFNGTRLHSALGYRTPDEFETATDEEVIKQLA
jgi:transposase InsO family protein